MELWINCILLLVLGRCFSNNLKNDVFFSVVCVAEMFEMRGFLS